MLSRASGAKGGEDLLFSSLCYTLLPQWNAYGLAEPARNTGGGQQVPTRRPVEAHRPATGCFAPKLQATGTEAMLHVHSEVRDPFHLVGGGVDAPCPRV